MDRMAYQAALRMEARFYSLAALVLMGTVERLNALMGEEFVLQGEIKSECLAVMAGLADEENA